MIAQITVSVLVVVVKSGSAQFLKAGLRIYGIQFPGFKRPIYGSVEYLNKRTFSSIFSVNRRAMSPKSFAPCI